MMPGVGDAVAVACIVPVPVVSVSACSASVFISVPASVSAVMGVDGACVGVPRGESASGNSSKASATAASTVALTLRVCSGSALHPTRPRIINMNPISDLVGFLMNMFLSSGANGDPSTEHLCSDHTVGMSKKCKGQEVSRKNE